MTTLADIRTTLLLGHEIALLDVRHEAAFPHGNDRGLRDGTHGFYVI